MLFGRFLLRGLLLGVLDGRHVLLGCRGVVADDLMVGREAMPASERCNRQIGHLADRDWMESNREWKDVDWSVGLGEWRGELMVEEKVGRGWDFEW